MKNSSSIVTVGYVIVDSTTFVSILVRTPTLLRGRDRLAKSMDIVLRPCKSGDRSEMK